VRPWLVVAGIIFLTLAAGTGATIYFAGQGNPARASAPIGPITLPVGPDGSETLSLAGVNGTAEVFSFSWHSTSPVAVVLDSPNGCSTPSGPCWGATTLDTWSSNTSGNWTGSGPFHYPLQCLLKNTHTDPSNVTLKWRASSTSPTHLSLAVEIVLGAGAAGLFAVGGLAVFLGLFLRSDPYGAEPRIVSRSADDMEELSRGPPPDH
jgi:hypothetical protein